MANVHGFLFECDNTDLSKGLDKEDAPKYAKEVQQLKSRRHVGRAVPGTVEVVDEKFLPTLF